MSFTEQINADIKSAMLAKEKEKLAALRDIKSKLLLEATSGSGEVSEETAIKIVMKLHKQRMETYALYIEQNREDLAQDELFQAQVIEAYLPKQMNEEEIKAAVLEVIKSVGAKGPADLGKVMGVITKQLAGKADGKTVAAIVKQSLTE